MGRIMKLIAPKEEGTTFTNHLGRDVEVALDNVEDVLFLTIGYEVKHVPLRNIRSEEVERIKKLTHQERLDLLLAKDDLMIREVEVNDNIEKLPKAIRYGNGGHWQPEILLKLNNKREKYSWDKTECYYEEFPAGVYLWEIRYKEFSKNKYMRTNNAADFSSDHIVGVGLTLSDAVFEIEKKLRTKDYTDWSILDEEQRTYYEAKK